MKHTGFSRRAFYFLMIIMIAPISLFSFSDQMTSERILRENKHFVHFIDVCVTNFADKKIDDFRKAYEIHFNADVAYLQADYKRTYKKVYASQNMLSGLYSEMVKDYYLEDSKNILDKIAPIVIRSKNARARLFLTLGYRDRTICWTHYTIGEASNPRLFSYKIYKYMKAIKYARRAKRYAFLALFESQNTGSKRKIYQHLMEKENKAGNTFFSRYAGLSEADYLKEMGKTFEQFEKDIDAKKGQEAGKTDTAKEGPGFEKKVEKRVRFREEKRTAKYLINTEFDQAEDIMRKNITDFNFKLISSTFEVLSGEGGKEIQDAGKVDFNAFKVHLMDNYTRLTKSSALESFYGKVNVEDKVDEEKIERGEGEADEHSIKEDKTPAKKADAKEATQIK